MNEAVLKDILWDWLDQNIGTRGVAELSFDGDFVTGNIINLEVNGDAISSVTFETSQAVTLEALRVEIASLETVFKAEITDERTIEVTLNRPGVALVIDSIAVTGGASQASGSSETLVAAVKVPVIFADQDDPRLPDTYATIRIDSLLHLGEDEFGEINDSGMLEMSGQRQMTVLFTFLGPDAVQVAEQARQSLEKRTVTDWLFNQGIAFSNKGTVRNLTSFYETKPQGAAAFDALVLFSESYEDRTGYFDATNLFSENLTNAQRSIVYQDASTVGHNAVVVDGTGYILTQASLNPQTSSWTIFANVFLEEINVGIDQAIYAQDRSGNVTEFIKLLGQDSKRGRFVSRVDGSTISSLFDVVKGRWVSLALRYKLQNQTLSFFVNGNLVREVNSITPISSTLIHKIGIGLNNDTDGFIGKIGPCAMYARALKNSEILNFSRGLKIQKSKSDEDFFFPLKDSSGIVVDVVHGNDGAIVNGTLDEKLFNSYQDGPILY